MVWMHTQTVDLMKKNGTFSSKKKSTSDLSEIIDFEVNPSEKKGFENINKIIIVLKTKKRNIRKLLILKIKMEKKFKKKNQLLKKKQLNILMKMIQMKEVKQNLLLKKTQKIIFKM